MRLASEAMMRDARTEQRLAAFIGWQVRAAASMDGKRPPTFRAYLTQLGIPAQDGPTASQVAAEKREREARMERVRSAFAERGAVKAASG